MNKSKYELVLCIVNAGFSEAVMDAAKEVGARGGTVIHARGTANREAEQFFNITIQPDKEVVMILVPNEIKDNVYPPPLTHKSQSTTKNHPLPQLTLQPKKLHPKTKTQVLIPINNCIKF